MDEHRSGCPINLTLEVLGDRWSLIVIRDVMFGNRRHFRELLSRSEEGIASNILADRLKRLVEVGLLSRATTRATSRRRSTASPNRPSSWCRCSRRWAHGGGATARPRRSCRSAPQLLEDGGPPMWEAFMDELRALHLGAPTKGASVLADLQAAYEAVVARNAAATKHVRTRPKQRRPL